MRKIYFNGKKYLFLIYKSSIWFFFMCSRSLRNSFPPYTADIFIKSDLFKHHEHNFFFLQTKPDNYKLSLPLMLFLQIISLRIVSSCASYFYGD